MSTIRVVREAACPGEIHPFQYGQFVEYLCDLVPSMWAEKLYDGSFEGLQPYKFAYRKETDFKEKPWYATGATNRANYTLDPETKISGKVSQRIEVAAGGTPCTVGLSQDGVVVDPAEPCVFTGHLRQLGVSGPIKITVHREGKILATTELWPSSVWQKFRARLEFSARETDATFTFSFRGPGALWIDNASLMPENSIGGWRRDVVEAVRAAKPGIIRFGGNALDIQKDGDFEWKDSIGDPDLRKPFTAWGGLQPTGPGIEEILQFCEHVGAEPLVCVRFEGRTPEDAAAQVEYLNGSTDTPMGALRARNSRARPYGVKYWQVGNERSGKAYEDRVRAFCDALKKADPSIVLMTSYPSDRVIENTRDIVQYICPHHYTPSFAQIEKSLADCRRMLNEHASRQKIKVGVTEWNSTAGDEGLPRAMLWSLENALHCARYHNLLHRNCDLVEIANRSNLINSFCSGFLQADRHRLYKTPAYYVQQLYATLAGNKPLKVATDSGAYDVSATIARDDKTLVLFVVNGALTDDIRSFDLSAFGRGGREMKVHTMADRDRVGEPDVTNCFGDPERIAVQCSTQSVSDAKFDYTLPALSLTVLEWPIV